MRAHVLLNRTTRLTARNHLNGFVRRKRIDVWLGEPWPRSGLRKVSPYNKASMGWPMTQFNKGLPRYDRAMRRCVLLACTFILLTAAWFGLNVLGQSHARSPSAFDFFLFYVALLGPPLAFGLLVRDASFVLVPLLAPPVGAVLETATLGYNGLQDLTYDIGPWGFLIYSLFWWFMIIMAFAAGRAFAVLRRRLRVKEVPTSRGI